MNAGSVVAIKMGAYFSNKVIKLALVAKFSPAVAHDLLKTPPNS